MTIQRLEHVGVVVDDLAEAIRFFVELGLELNGQGSVEGDWVGRVIGLEDVRADIAILQTPDGQGKLELVKFIAPVHTGAVEIEPSNAPGLRHVLFSVDDVEAAIATVRRQGYELVGSLEQYEDMYKLCYVRGPGGIIVELAEKLS